MRLHVLRFGWILGALLASHPAFALDTPSKAGDLTVTEFMAYPTVVPDYYGQWVEIYNASGKDLSLTGLTVTSPGQPGFTLTGSHTLTAGAFFVLGVSDVTDEGDVGYNGSVNVNYVYDWDEFRLESTGDTITLTFGARTIDTMTWDYTVQRDASLQANLNAYNLEWANDLPQNWCTSDAFIPYSPSLKGTPGSANEWCDASNRDTDGDGFTPTSGDCDDTDPYVNPLAIDGASDPFGVADDDADCDGVRDDGTSDDDLDGYAEVLGDCDDDDDKVFPGGWEGTSDAMADSRDNDCNCFIDDLDYDRDGFSDYANTDYDPASGTWLDPETEGHVLAVYDASPGCDDPRERDPVVYPDCDNWDDAIYPGQTEAPYDGIDQDCNGFDMCDVDGDGFDALDCPDGTDCDDTNPAVNPNASEGTAPDGVDNDCTGVIDDPFQDQDGDGYSVLDGDCLDDPLDPRSKNANPGVAVDSCDDLVDNDCNGLLNDGCSNPFGYATIQGGGCSSNPSLPSRAAVGALLAALLLSLPSRRRG